MFEGLKKLFGVGKKKREKEERIRQMYLESRRVRRSRSEPSGSVYPYAEMDSGVDLRALSPVVEDFHGLGGKFGGGGASGSWSDSRSCDSGYSSSYSSSHSCSSDSGSSSSSDGGGGGGGGGD